jgi:hypothetical protein
MKIYKNFLDKEDFSNLKNALLGSFFPWYFSPQIDDSYNDKRFFQFFHSFYDNYNVNSSLFHLVSPLVKKICPISLIRIKANLLGRTEKIQEHGMHTDYNINQRSKGIKTAIFYCNTNNGYTIFKDGTKVNSEENKFIEFDVNKEHTGSSCTDQQVRIVINLNYF